MSWFKKLANSNSDSTSSNENTIPLSADSEEAMEYQAQAEAAQELDEMQEIQEEREQEEQAQEDQLVVIDGAKIKMGPHLGEFKVLNDVTTTQGKLTGTIVEKSIENFTFYDGFQLKTILGNWQDYGSYKVQENEVLIKKSTLQVTGKLPGNNPIETGPIEIMNPGQVNIPETIETTGTPAPEVTSSDLKKFIVHFRRPSDYQGKYGFDWLRDEYIHPIVTVTNDNNGDSINTPTPLCKNVEDLKTEYRDTSINPYGKHYYPAWLSIFPNTTTAQFPHGSSMHRNGIKLDIEIEEIEELEQDDTELFFESNNKYLTITPNKLPLKNLLNSKKSKDLSGKTVNFYSASKIVNIKCSGGTLNSHTDIKVFAKNGNSPKIEVGKLKVYKNNVIPKAEFVVVNVVTDDNEPGAKLKEDYQYIFKNQSFNQALIRAEVKVDTIFNITKIKSEEAFIFLQNKERYTAKDLLENIKSLYQKYGKYGDVKDGLDSDNTKRTFLFYTSLSANKVRGIASLDYESYKWGNSLLILNSGLKNQRTIVHEAGHSLSLAHVFQEGALTDYTFYHGYTDNYMDYDWQMGNLIYTVKNGRRSLTPTSSGSNIYSGKMYSFFKWQWDILRKDRSLTVNY